MIEMDNFEDWAYENGLSRTKDEDGYFSKNTEFASKAWQHQQAKVDEYILVAETLDELYVKEVEKNRKLQKRVDALEKSEFVLARIRSIVSKRLLESILIKEVRQVLKGEV